MTASLDVARMETDLRQYEVKSENDDRLINLLKEQNSQQAREMETLITEYAEKIRRLSQERDEAVRQATEVSGILNQSADAILSGLRKMKGDETPPAPKIEPNAVPQIAKMEQVNNGEVQLRNILSRLPKNEMAS